MIEYADVRKAVEQKYLECYEVAKSRGIDLTQIPIEWNLRGTVAGKFCFNYGKTVFKVNLELARYNLEEYLGQTVPHEFSHYIVYARYFSLGKYCKPHGLEWKSTMRNIFGCQPKRCHSYDISQVSRRKYVYKCNCRHFYLGVVRHRRMQRNPFMYRCPRCKAFLVYGA